MLISLNWIQQYLPTIDQVDAEEVANKLTAALAEVESITVLGKGLEGIVTGQVTEIEKHPKFDKLSICQVQVGEGQIKQIITGAPNIKEGQMVVVCLPGGSVYNPEQKIGSQQVFKIVEKEFKGVNSQGMICSAKELGLYEEHTGIMVLPETTPLGLDLSYDLHDTIFEIENKSLGHRPDCFSHLGIAREIAALFNLDIAQKPTLNIPLTPGHILPLKIEVKADDLCNRFTAIIVKDTKVAPSPIWMQIKLAYVGTKPINSIVDITNYMMFDIGEPLHAFDYSKINGSKITVRKSKQGEKFLTLDGVERTLGQDHIILSDSKENIGSPVMGGQDSEIKDDTTTIVLIAEAYDNFAVRRMSRELGLRTEASTRFEKGTSAAEVKDKLELATSTLLDIAGGEVASEIYDIYPNVQEERVIEFDLNSVKRLLGIDLSKENIINILESLNIQIEGKERISEGALANINESNHVNLIIPLYRLDLKLPIDIIEEIARIYGYHNFESAFPWRDIAPAKKNQDRVRLSQIKHLMSSYGANEVYTYAFVGNNMVKNARLNPEKLIKIKNPLSPELSLFRNVLLPSLIDKIELNVTNNFDDFALFEVSRVAQDDKKNDEGLPYQPFKLAAVVYSKTGKDTYLKIKGYLDQLIEDLNLSDITITNVNSNTPKEEANVFHPVQTGMISLKNEIIGFIGNIHPMVQENFDLKGAISVMEIELTSLLDQIKEKEYKGVIQLPEVYRDISFWVDSKAEVGAMMEGLYANSIPNLKKVSLIDTFPNKTDPLKKSITLQLIFQSDMKTLNDQEIKQSMEKLTSALIKSHKVEIR